MTADVLPAPRGRGGWTGRTPGGVTVAGREVTALGDGALERFPQRTVGQVVQSPGLPPLLTALLATHHPPAAEAEVADRVVLMEDDACCGRPGRPSEHRAAGIGRGGRTPPHCPFFVRLHRPESSRCHPRPAANKFVSIATDVWYLWEAALERARLPSADRLALLHAVEKLEAYGPCSRRRIRRT